jgi:hypothetical protein
METGKAKQNCQRIKNSWAEKMSDKSQFDISFDIIKLKQNPLY